MTGLRLLLLAFAALVYGVAVDWSVITMAAIALILIVVVSFIWSRWSIRDIGFSRTLESDKVQVGDKLREQMRIENRGALPKPFLEIQDRSTLPLHRADRVVSLGSHSVRTWEAESVALRRGSHQLGPVSLRSGDPLGLFRRERRVSGTIELTVYPMILNLNQYTPLSALQSGGGIIHRRSTVPTAAVGGIRDYTVGDAINRISWTATARAGHLMVKEFEIDPTADLWVLLDLYNPSEELPEPSDWDLRSNNQLSWLGNTFEYRVMLTASLIRRTLALGRSVGFVMNTPQPVILPPERSDRQFVRALEQLAVVSPTAEQSLFNVASGVQHRITRDSAVVIVTSHPDPNVMNLLGHMRRRSISPEVILVEENMDSVPVPDEVLINRIACYNLTRFDDPSIALNSAAIFARQVA
jgi:uncharacterized protein (DUF58 family)